MAEVPMRFGSVCSGIEAASVAWRPLGWQAAWLAEIEPFPSAVLRHHYPTVFNLGDMTTLPERILRGDVEAPDLFCGGTPCQAFSVAGLRKSLDDTRGNLSLTFCEIANAIDAKRSQPCIVFWENVPGVLSTKDNAFGCFLAGLAGEDEALVPPRGRWTNAGFVDGPKRTVAWRILDAQYFGVAQRRRRVFVIASARTDFDPAAVLFEFEGVRRDTAPSREAGQGIAVCPTLRAGGNRTGGDRPPGTDVDTADSLIPVTAQCITTGTGQRYDTETETILPVTHSLRGEGFDASEDGIGRGTPLVPVAFAKTHKPMSAEDAEGWAAISITPTITHWPRDRSDTGTDVAVTQRSMQVRRLTPVECERLQGFPDGYTAVPWRGKPADQCPDGPRYKALGNSWAVPVVRWIGERIARAA